MTKLAGARQGSAIMAALRRLVRVGAPRYELPCREENLDARSLAGDRGRRVVDRRACPFPRRTARSFFWLSQINKASAVMIVERRIVPKPLGARIFDAINRVDVARRSTDG
jgi:hypothetical protein